MHHRRKHHKRRKPTSQEDLDYPRIRKRRGRPPKIKNLDEINLIPNGLYPCTSSPKKVCGPIMATLETDSENSTNTDELVKNLLKAETETLDSKRKKHKHKEHKHKEHCKKHRKKRKYLFVLQFCGNNVFMFLQML